MSPPSPSRVPRPVDLNVQFSGNLSAEQRAAIVDFEDHVMRGPAHFGKATTSRLELRDVDVYERPEISQEVSQDG